MKKLILIAFALASASAFAAGEGNGFNGVSGGGPIYNGPAVCGPGSNGREGTPPACNPLATYSGSSDYNGRWATMAEAQAHCTYPDVITVNTDYGFHRTVFRCVNQDGNGSQRN